MGGACRRDRLGSRMRDRATRRGRRGLGVRSAQGCTPEKPPRLWQLARVQGSVTAQDAVGSLAKAIAGARDHEAHALFICAAAADDGGPVWRYETTAPAEWPPRLPRLMVEETTMARAQRLGS
jgi:hypothetical protein